MKLFASFLLVLRCILPLHAALTTPRFISDNMVIQRDTKVALWGWGVTRGQTVTVTIAEQTKTAVAGATGEWKVMLDPMTAGGGPHTLQISSPSGSRSISNVLLGEVWIGSGQSNMAVTIGWLNIPGFNTQTANYPKIRYFKIPPGFSEAPQRDVAGAPGDRFRPLLLATALLCSGILLCKGAFHCA